MPCKEISYLNSPYNFNLISSHLTCEEGRVGSGCQGRGLAGVGDLVLAVQAVVAEPRHPVLKHALVLDLHMVNLAGGEGQEVVHST